MVFLLRIMINIPQIPDVYKKGLLFTVVLAAAILPVFFFISSKKSTEADLIRIAHLSLIQERVNDALRRGVSIPLPQNALELNFWQVKLGYQWRAGKDLFLALWVEFLKDPDTGEMYHYFIRPDTKDYEVVSLLDDSKYANFKIGETPAYSLGSSKGNVLVINSGKNAGKLVSSVLTTGQKVDLSKPDKRKQIGWEAQKSCQEIKNKNLDAKSGKYVIEMDNKLISVYCDMRTEDGGWMLFYANNGHPASEIKMSYVEMREALDNVPIDNLAEYDNPNLAGLLNYRYFIWLWAKEVLIRNRTGDPTKWVKFTFSTPDGLEWALGERILGETAKWCSKIPVSGTWSIINQDGKIKYDNLTHIMNQKWVSWWVSHENTWCNDFIGNANPNIAFYSSKAKEDGARTRGTDGVWGAWGWENEYRYFIR